VDPVQTLSLALLALALILAIWRRINIGLLALAATFVLALTAHLTAEDVYEAFPGSIFVLLVGVSLLFGHLERSGALTWFVDRVYRLIGERTHLIPWAGFLIGAVLSSLGAFATAPITLLVPTIAHLSRRFPRSFLISELAVVIGANSAGLSPLNPAGAVIRKVADQHHISYQPWLIWALSLAMAAAVVLVLQIGLARFRGPAAGQNPQDIAADAQPYTRPLVIVDEDAARGLRPAYAITAAASLLVFVLFVVFAKTDVGLTAVALVIVLQLLFRPEEKKLLRSVPWPSVLLLCGLLTYLGALQSIGTMDTIQAGLESTGSQVLLVFLLAYMTAALCNIESSTLGVLGLVMPLVFSAFGENPALTWVLAAVAAPATLTVMNPIHVAGTLIISYTDERDQQALFRRLLALSLGITCVAPGLAAIVPALLI